MEKIKNREQEIVERGTTQKMDKQIPLSRAEFVFQRKIKWENPIRDKYLYIVPWQQVRCNEYPKT